MQKSQKQTSESSRKGYERAKEMIKNLREKNGKLKTELKNEQNKTLQLEEELSKLKEADRNEKSAHLEESYHIDKANPDQAQSLNEVVKKLESEKATLEMSNSKLQERISCLKAMREAEPVRFTCSETVTQISPSPRFSASHLSIFFSCLFFSFDRTLKQMTLKLWFLLTPCPLTFLSRALKQFGRT